MENILPSILELVKQDKTLQEYIDQTREIQEAAAECATLGFSRPKQDKWATRYNKS